MAVTKASALLDTRQMAMRVAAQTLFSGSRFDICAVRDLMDLAGVGRYHECEAFKILHALHCVDYARMPDELRVRIPHLVNECLRPPVAVAQAVEVAMDGVGVQAP